MSTAEDASDFELLEHWRSGNKAGGEQLFTRHFRPLFRFFRTKIGDDPAEDLTQASFLACVEMRDDFRNASSFRTYLFAVARNQLYMYFRKRGRQQALIEFQTISVADLGAGPGSLLAAKAEQRLLLRALREIPVDFQIAVELFYWEGMPTRDLAVVLGVPEGTVRSRLARAREHLTRKMLKLAETRELAQSTMADFERWATSLRNVVGVQSPSVGDDDAR